MFFPVPFKYAPRVVISSVVSRGSDPTVEFLVGTPMAQPGAFVVEILSSDAIIAPVQIAYEATFQGACDSHDHCPLSQYCDEYLGCDDCSMCQVLGDTFDGGDCPARCGKDS